MQIVIEGKGYKNMQTIEFSRYKCIEAYSLCGDSRFKTYQDDKKNTVTIIYSNYHSEISVVKINNKKLSESIKIDNSLNIEDQFDSIISNHLSS